MMESSFRNVSADLSKKRLWHRCFPMNIVKILIIPILHFTSRWALLQWNLYKADTTGAKKMCLLYTDVHFVEIFSK